MWTSEREREREVQLVFEQLVFDRHIARGSIWWGLWRVNALIFKKWGDVKDQQSINLSFSAKNQAVCPAESSKGPWRSPAFCPTRIDSSAAVVSKLQSFPENSTSIFFLCWLSPQHMMIGSPQFFCCMCTCTCSQRERPRLQQLFAVVSLTVPPMRLKLAVDLCFWTSSRGLILFRWLAMQLTSLL